MNKLYSSIFFRHKDITLLLLLALVIIASGIGLRDPWPADEPRFVLIAKEMVESGQWLFPQRGGELYPDKPPIFIWLQAILYFLTHEIRAFLIPSLLASLGSVFLVYDLGRRLWNKTVGLYAAFALLASLQFTMQSKLAQIDALLCFWVTLGLYGLLRHLLLGPQWTFYYLSFFSMGIGIITKGVGFLPVLLLPAAALFNAVQRRAYAKTVTSSQPINCAQSIIIKPLSLSYGTKKSWFGWFFLLLPIMSWLIPMALTATDLGGVYANYRDNILLRQTVQRYASSWHHLKPFWFYILTVLPWAWFPLVLAFPLCVQLLKKRLWFKPNPRFFLLFAWIAFAIIFFSISKGKRGVYMLPTLPALSLLMAPFLVTLRLNFNFQKVAFVLGVFIFVIIEAGVIASIAGVIDLSVFSAGFQARLIYFGASFLMLFLGLLFYFRVRRGWFFLCSILLSVWFILPIFLYPHFNEIRTPLRVLHNIEKHSNLQTEIGMINFREQFVLFSTFKMTHFGYHALIKQQVHAAQCWQGKDEKNRFLLMSAEVAADNFNQASERIDVGRAHGENWVLVRGLSSISKPDCAHAKTFTARVAQDGYKH